MCEARVTKSALTTEGALVELDKSRSQVERLAIRPVHGLIELGGVPEGGPDAAGYHDQGLADGVVMVLPIDSPWGRLSMAGPST
jgi:hypothetical protein